MNYNIIDILADIISVLTIISIFICVLLYCSCLYLNIDVPCPLENIFINTYGR